MQKGIVKAVYRPYEIEHLEKNQVSSPARLATATYSATRTIVSTKPRF